MATVLHSIFALLHCLSLLLLMHLHSYSSRDNETLREQFAGLSKAGVDSVMLSWWGQKDRDVDRDSQGVNTDLLVPAVLDAAADAGMRVSWHLEP